MNTIILNGAVHIVLPHVIIILKVHWDHVELVNLLPSVIKFVLHNLVELIVQIKPMQLIHIQ